MMLSRTFRSKPDSLNSKAFLQVCTLASLALVLNGCSEDEEKAPPPPKGTVNVDTVKVGSLEDTFKRAVITFVLDTNKNATIGDSVQYMSRSKDSKGGTVLARCRAGKCVQLSSVYSPPITKDDALETMKNMLPANTPPQSKVDDTQVTEAKVANPEEIYFFGEDYKVYLTYSDKSAQKVRDVRAIDQNLEKEFIDSLKAAKEKVGSPKELGKPAGKEQGGTTDGVTPDKTKKD
jgi:hypothetical protein